MGTLAEAAAVPAFRIAFAWLAILADPAWEPAANTLAKRPAWSAASPYWLSDKVSESTASLRVMSLAAACNRIASSVTCFNASLSPSSSGLAEPTNMKASRISAADWRTRNPSFVMVVESVLACSVSQAILSSSSPVKAFSPACDSSNLLRSSLMARNARVKPVRKPITERITPPKRLNQSTMLPILIVAFLVSVVIPLISFWCCRKMPCRFLILAIVRLYSSDPIVMSLISRWRRFISVTIALTSFLTSLPSM